jgi:hypothetical protein
MKNVSYFIVTFLLKDVQEKENFRPYLIKKGIILLLCINIISNHFQIIKNMENSS